MPPSRQTTNFEKLLHKDMLVYTNIYPDLLDSSIAAMAAMASSSAAPTEVPPVPIWPHALTKYERTKVVGMRAEQLARGAQPFVDAVVEGTGAKFDPCEVAERELLSRKLPFYITRPHADGKPEIVKLWEVRGVDASEL